jgi:Domain of unknown function (DUF397)
LVVYGNVLPMTVDAATDSSPAHPTTAAAAWRSSSYCANGSCVEVSIGGEHVGIRDNKDLAAGELWLTPAEFHAFIAAVRGDVFG